MRSADSGFQRIAGAPGGLPNVKMLERYKCRWGDDGIVRAALGAIRELARQEFPCDYAIFLSEKDYPLKLDVGCNTGRGGAVLKDCNALLQLTGLDCVPERVAALDRIKMVMFPSEISPRLDPPLHPAPCLRIISPGGPGWFDAHATRRLRHRTRACGRWPRA